MSRRRGRPKKIYCILCKKEVKKADKKRIVAVDRPVRIDILVHRNCLKNSDEKQLKSAIKQHISPLL